MIKNFPILHGGIKRKVYQVLNCYENIRVELLGYLQRLDN